jgi:hypothetical protein
MKAHLELSDEERIVFRTLTDEERDVMLEQLLLKAREDLEWQLAIESAHAEPAAPAKSPVAEPRPRPPAIPRSSSPRLARPLPPRRAVSWPPAHRR